MTPVWLEILTACVVASVLEMAIHWAPWPATVKKSLQVQFMLRCLAFLLPASYLLATWHNWVALAAVWSCLVVCVIVIAALISLDRSIERAERLDIAEKEAKKLRPEVQHGKTGRDT